VVLAALVALALWPTLFADLKDAAAAAPTLFADPKDATAAALPTWAEVAVLLAPLLEPQTAALLAFKASGGGANDEAARHGPLRRHEVARRDMHGWCRDGAGPQRSTG
jgi:hypothetical protein